MIHEMSRQEQIEIYNFLFKYGEFNSFNIYIIPTKDFIFKNNIIILEGNYCSNILFVLNKVYLNEKFVSTHSIIENENKKGRIYLIDVYDIDMIETIKANKDIIDLYRYNIISI